MAPFVVGSFNMSPAGLLSSQSIIGSDRCQRWSTSLSAAFSFGQLVPLILILVLTTRIGTPVAADRVTVHLRCSASSAATEMCMTAQLWVIACHSIAQNPGAAGSRQRKKTGDEDVRRRWHECAGDGFVIDQLWLRPLRVQ